MINSSKITVFTTFYMLVLALIPGVVVDEFLNVPGTARVGTLLACVLFLIGLHLGAKLVRLEPPAFAPGLSNSSAAAATIRLPSLWRTSWRGLSGRSGSPVNLLSLVPRSTLEGTPLTHPRRLSDVGSI